MFNSIRTCDNAHQVQRVAYVAGYGYKLAVKQSKSVSYRRATNGQKPKNARELSRVSA